MTIRTLLLFTVVAYAIVAALFVLIGHPSDALWFAVFAGVGFSALAWKRRGR